uniref:L71-9 n=1 Tax=Drosophila melanogaster TaxID=7227 RepID=Q27252_DROME|nr:L71-9 [Drosophila melanogaster]AAA74182.1 L71-9 [Drosophila melanogaster]prf//2205331G L71-9 gene [Drosophila melanogaster]
MLKLLLPLAIVCLFMAHIQANPEEANRRHKICIRTYDKCIENEARLGKQDDTSKFFNDYCRRSDSGWSDVSRCDLLRIACLSTVRDWQTPTCKNVAHRMRLW